MSFRHTFETVLLIGLGDDQTEYDVRVSGTYYPGTPGRWFVDPEPPEPESFEIDGVSVKVADGRWMAFPDWLVSKDAWEALADEGMKSALGFEAHCEELAADLRAERLERSLGWTGA